MSRLACVGIVLTVLPLSAGIDRACAQTTDMLAAISATASKPISATASKLSPVDYNFVAQANLGAPFHQKPGTLRSQDWFDNPDKPRLDH